jgi:hypothetical protein
MEMSEMEEVERVTRVTVWNRLNEIIGEFSSVEAARRFVDADPVLKKNYSVEVRTLEYV